ncbi:MAG: shikimate kinase [Catonella sp.]|nr:shikimate kinase [Catonella sp.]MDY6356705.1 shikimate kinase [Catonella sp.]
MDKTNITLIGMPGSGKSTVGVILAKAAGFNFIDGDLLIQEREHRLLREIIADEGTDGFKRIEDEVNASIETENSVISPGGSIVYCENAMAHLKEISTVVYLYLEYEALANRLGDLTKRGVVLKPGFTLRDLYNERSPLYEKYADFTVDADKGTPQAVMREIVRKLNIENRV